MTKKNVEIKLQNGLEARPVAMLVQVASKYDSVVYLESAGKKVNAKSIMGMMSLGLNAGEEAVEETAEEVAVTEIEKYLCGEVQHFWQKINKDIPILGEVCYIVYRWKKFGCVGNHIS